MARHIACPLCGRKLAAAEPGSRFETECVRCRNTYVIFVDIDGGIFAKEKTKQQDLVTKL